MTKRQVKRLLGPPHGKISTRQYERKVRRSGVYVVDLSGSPSNQHYWLYRGVPPGHDTQIVFKRGRVVEVQTPPAR